MLDLILTKKEGLIAGVKIKGSLGCSDHKMEEFRTWRGGSEQDKKQNHNPGLQESRLWPLQGSAWQIKPWDKALEGRGA